PKCTESFYVLSGMGKNRMTTITLVNSSKETETKESSSFDILVRNEKLGDATVYYATDEEVKAFRKYLKKKIKRGDAYKVKIVLGEKLPDRSTLLEIRDKFLVEYPKCDASNILFIRRDADKLIPLTDGKKLEENVVGRG
ncbi:MAG: hypothetical protein ACUVTL_08310, partial [Thermoproteota archaeon]